MLTEREFPFLLVDRRVPMDSFVVGSSIKYCLGKKRSRTGARNSQVNDWLDLVCSESVPLRGGQKGWV